MHKQLSRLLAPLEPTAFFAQYWSRMHLWLRREARHWDEWLTLDGLDTFFRAERYPAASFSVVSAGEPEPIETWSRWVGTGHAGRGHYMAVDAERLFQLYQRGATVILNHAHCAIPSLSHACRVLTQELGFPVWANIYITPPDARGFNRHSDDHEVFILQIEGSKSWTVHPWEGDPIELELKAGDLLYLPRLMAHEARSGTTASIHVTIGMSPVYLFSLVEELAALAKEHPAFQQIVSRTNPDSQQNFDTELNARLREILDRTTTKDLFTRRFRTLVADQAKGWPNRLSDLVRAEDISRDTTVCAHAGMLYAITADGNLLNLDFAGNQLVVPAFLKGCLATITSGLPFKVGELEGLLSETGKIELVQRFVRAGFLTICA